MIPILAGYVVWLPSILGLGTLFIPKRRSLPTCDDPVRLLLLAILGLRLLGFTALLLNFFAPVGVQAALVMLFAGWLLLFLNRRTVVDAISAAWPSSRLSFAVVVLLLLAWTALVASRSRLVYDAGLYYIQSIKWIVESQLPRGLANLHGRLGFNSLWFPVAAALEIPFLRGRSIFVVNGLLYATYGLAVASAMLQVVKRRLSLSSIFLALTAIAWLPMAQQGSVGSASPDLPASLLAYASVVLTIRSLESQPEANGTFYIVMALLVAAFAVTVKLSMLPLLMAPIAASLWACRASACGKNAASKALVSSLLPVAALLIPWMLRGVMLSGYPLYPAPFSGASPLPWAVPADQVRSEALWIMSWARRPGASPEVVLRDWNWLPGWLANLKPTLVFRLGAILPFLGALLWLGAGRRGPVRKQLQVVATLAIPLSLGLLYWFLSAPDLRFGQPYIWSLGFVAMASGMMGLDAAYAGLGPGLRRMFAAGIAGVLLYTLSFSAGIYEGVTVSTLSELPAIPATELRRNLTQEGAVVFSPVDGDQCWSAPLPCAASFSENLRVTVDDAGRPVEFRLGR